MSNPGEAEGKEVCVVDDDLSVLKSIHYLLASEGFKVRAFNKAEDFLAHAGAHYVACHCNGHRPGRFFHETV